MSAQYPTHTNPHAGPPARNPGTRPLNRIDFEAIPELLQRRHRWFLWRYEKSHQGTLKRYTYRPCGRHATYDDRRSWSPLPYVRDAYERHLRIQTPYDGIGFALGDNFTAIELENVVVEEGAGARGVVPGAGGGVQNPLLPWAAELVGQLATYTELNPDGSGLTLVVRETLAGPNIQPTAHPAGGTIAIRREPYYFCITGHRRPLGSRQTIVDRSAELERLTDVLRSGNPAVIGSGLGGTTAGGGGEKGVVATGVVATGGGQARRATEAATAAPKIEGPKRDAPQPAAGVGGEPFAGPANRASPPPAIANREARPATPAGSASEATQPSDEHARRLAELHRAEAAALKATEESRIVKAELQALFDSLPRGFIERLANTKPVSGYVPRPSSMQAYAMPPRPLAAPTRAATIPTKAGGPRDGGGPGSGGTAGEGEADPRIADQLVELALTEFRLGRTPADETFAVALRGPNIAHMLRGGSAPLRKALARAFRRRYGRTLGSSTLNDALNVIDAEAGELEPEPVALRVAALRVAPPLSDVERGLGKGATEGLVEGQGGGAAGSLADETQNTKRETLPKHEAPKPAPARLASRPSEGIVVDLGRPDGQAVVVTPEGWRIVDRSPVLFRRTPLTEQLPLPERGGSLGQLRGLVNVGDEGYEMLRGWLVAGLFPSIAHSILVLRGARGTGKTTALGMLAALVDPSAALPFGAPTDLENWALIANGGWCLQLDNIAGISPWFSQELCRAVTGRGTVRRRLYTDGDFSVVAFRRVVALTCIHLGPIADDLADRLLPVDLEFIDRGSRLSETDLLARFAALRPQLFGALLDEAAAVLGNLPHVHIAELPRMADFARILAALRSAPETPPEKTPLAIYQRIIDRLLAEVVEEDPVVTAIGELMKSRQEWRGTAGDLLAALGKIGANRNLPKTPSTMRMQLDRLAPALKSMAIGVDYGRANDYMRSRLVILTSVGTGEAGEESLTCDS